MTEARSTHDELIENHQGLVRALARQILNKFQQRFELDDLVAYGQVGLIEAAREFDPDRGTQFSTYAYYRVRGAIYDGISKMNWVERETRRKARFRQMAGEVLQADQEASPASNSAESGAAWLVQITRQLTVVHFATGAEDALADRSDDESSVPAAALNRRELHDRLHALIEALPDEERQLVRTTYFEGLSLQDAATRMGFSKSWASRLHAKSLQRLAAGLRREGLAE